MNKLAYQQLKAWSKRRHPKKNMSWIKNRCWQTIGGDNWVFASKEKGKRGLVKLSKYSETPILRYVKVQGNRSPYNGDLVYWSVRIHQIIEEPDEVKVSHPVLKGRQGRETLRGALNLLDLSQRLLLSPLLLPPLALQHCYSTESSKCQ